MRIVFVDEQVYRELPSFIVGTVDKFTMVPWRAETGMLFARVSAMAGREMIEPGETVPKGATRLPHGLRPPGPTRGPQLRRPPAAALAHPWSASAAATSREPTSRHPPRT